MSLTRLSGLRNMLTGLRRQFFTRFGCDIDPTGRMSMTAKFDLTFPKGVHVGPHTYVAFNARILTHDRTHGLYLHTRIGANCFIGGESLVLPGITIGDNCVIGAGGVVTRDVPPRSVVAGNPARILRSDSEVGLYGRFKGADEREIALRSTNPDLGGLPSKHVGTI